MKTTAEVIIVGGGVVGNAAAYYLAKRGVEVIVLEGSDSIGHGGSSRNGGGTFVVDAYPVSVHAWEWRWCQTVWTRCKRTAICDLWY